MNCVKTSGLSLVRVRGCRILIIVHKTQSNNNKSISIDKKNKTTVNMQIRFQYFFFKCKMYETWWLVSTLCVFLIYYFFLITSKVRITVSVWCFYILLFCYQGILCWWQTCRVSAKFINNLFRLRLRLSELELQSSLLLKIIRWTLDLCEVFVSSGRRFHLRIPVFYDAYCINILIKYFDFKHYL